ncbi:MAG: hypothetical protein ABS939_23215 [Psychrobacillus sp.]|uniref:hypothetical protein n=1 Tax=Solibacillus sp. FSL R7-0682 TaxID=2921690 RepID=UPI0030FB6D0D
MIPIVFLHKSGEEVKLSVNYLMFNNEEEFIKTSEETLIAIVKDLGYNAVQILTSGENTSMFSHNR